MEAISSIPILGPILFWVLPFLIVLSIVVAIHELGHLMVGRWCGIKAEVYSIGFGKVLWSRVDRHGTKWQVAALPFGGYVKFLGDMDPASAGHADEEDIPPEDRHRAFHNAALWRRTLTVAAGPLANFLLSIAIFWGISLYLGKNSPEPVIASIGDLDPKQVGFRPGDRILEIDGKTVATFGEATNRLLTLDGKPTPVVVERDGKRTAFETRYSLPPVIAGMLPDGSAAAAGVRIGDKVLTIDNHQIRSLRDLQVTISNLPHEKEIGLVVLRDGKEVKLSFTPRLKDNPDPHTGKVRKMPFFGVHLLAQDALRPTRIPVGPGEALERAAYRVWHTISNTVVFINAMLFKGATTDHLAGPIGIAKFSSKAATNGLVEFIGFVALISTAIGLFNLFPIPILDGGHLCFYLIEAIRRRPANDAVVRYSTMAGFSLLILLMVFVTFNNDLGLGEWFTRE